MKIILECLLCLLCFMSCTTNGTVKDESVKKEDIANNYANINFSNWKVTLPVDLNNDGNPDEYGTQYLIDYGYQKNASIKNFMYDDVSDKSIVFYTYPATSTSNSNYSRTELRELIDSNNSKINWDLETGGKMVGTLKMESITADNTSSKYNYHRVIVMQIHGIIKEKDMISHNFISNNGPPLLKIFWIDGKIIAYKKTLVNENVNGDDLLDVSSNTWKDVSHDFGYVGFDSFTFSITASKGKLILSLNNGAPNVFSDISLQKWPFENYFKAGNYLITTDSEAKSKVKYFDLKVWH